MDFTDPIWQRAEGLCENIINGKRCYSNQLLSKHHIQIKGMGGRKKVLINGIWKDIDCDENLELLCYQCHAKKHGERVTLP